MDALQAILTRRSVRRFTPRAVPPELVDKVLRAAMAAPSAGNQQPWHFVVIDDRALLDAIPAFHPYANMLKEAPSAIVVCGDGRLEQHQGYWVQDCAAATENLLLAAHALALGAVWVGVYPREERVTRMQELLGIPAEVTPLGLVALGYPAEQPEPADRFNRARIHRNGW